MTCEEFHRILNEFIDGELDSGRLRKAERHLAGCPGCRAEEGELRRLIDAAAALPRTKMPDRDLWAGIAAAASKGSPAPGGRAVRRGRSLAWLTLPRLAAAAVVLVGLTVAVTLKVVRPGREGPVPQPRGPSVTAVAMPADFRAAEAEFQQATDMLNAVIERRRGELSPETVALVEDNLQIINGAIAAVQSAIETDPGNRDLGLLLTTMYRTRIDLLQRAARLPAAI